MVQYIHDCRLVVRIRNMEGYIQHAGLRLGHGENPGGLPKYLLYQSMHPTQLREYIQSSAHLREDEVAIISLHLCMGADQERRLADQEL